MSKIELITPQLPINNTPEFNSLISPLMPYKAKRPKIRKLKNVFVTHEGLVLNNGLIANGCAFNLKGKEDNTLYAQFWRDTIEKFAVCKWGKSLKSITLKGEGDFLLIHSTWFNYSFWINSFLPRLISAIDSGLLKNTKLIVPEGWKEIPYVWDSINEFNIDFEIIPKDYHLFVKNLIMPETRQWSSSFYPPSIAQTRIKLVNIANQKIKEDNTKVNRVYLTRSKRGVRNIHNENEVIELLKKHGFTVVTFENLTIWEQINLMSNTSHFVSIHGAGLSNMMFMNKGSSVLELINRPYAKAEYTFPFWKLANAAELNYFSQLCDVKKIPENNLSFRVSNEHKELDYLVNQDIIVDIDLLERNLHLMLNPNNSLLIK